MSNISTSIEQSKKLLSLGLKPETADCCWVGKTIDWKGEEIKNPRYRFNEEYTEHWIVQNFEHIEVIPSWAVPRLVELADQKGITIMRGGRICDVERDEYYVDSDIFENLISLLKNLIEREEIDQKYLTL